MADPSRSRRAEGPQGESGRDTAGPVLLIFFPARSPGGPEVASLRGLAESIAREPGLRRKIRAGSAAEGRAGGVYLFENRAAAEACHRMHAERLARMGAAGIAATYWETGAELSAVTRAPIG